MVAPLPLAGLIVNLPDLPRTLIVVEFDLNSLYYAEVSVGAPRRQSTEKRATTLFDIGVACFQGYMVVKTSMSLLIAIVHTFCF